MLVVVKGGLELGNAPSKESCIVVGVVKGNPQVTYPSGSLILRLTAHLLLGLTYPKESAGPAGGEGPFGAVKGNPQAHLSRGLSSLTL